MRAVRWEAEYQRHGQRFCIVALRDPGAAKCCWLDDLCRDISLDFPYCQQPAQQPKLDVVSAVWATWSKTQRGVDGLLCRPGMLKRIGKQSTELFRLTTAP